MKNIVAATFQPGHTTAKVLGLWQYDYGQILRVQGLELPDAVEIHFSLQEKGGESERQVGLTRDGVTEVAVPNSYLENAGTSRDYSIYAFLYISDGKSGNTEYKITMYVQSRPEPKDPETPEDPKDDPFGKTIEAVNEAMKSAQASAEAAAESEKSASESATRAEKSAVESQESAKAAATSEKAAATSATAAAESESRSRESATIARSAADQAAKSATAAAESETTAAQQAQNAAQSATNALSAAESASQSAETAKTAADTAGKSASGAQQAAGSAAESASTASTAAQTATTAAREAAESATSSARSAETAGQKATAAETSASKAAESAAEAAKSATAAEDSASTAKTSETAAEEAAQTAQEQAEKIVESAEQIEKNKTGVAALEEKKADKTTLAVTERKLDALWKLNQGISYKFEEDSEAAYQKEVPSGAKLASVKRIGGKTIVWNQLIKNCEGETEITCTNADGYVSYRADFDIPVVGHKYLVSFECCIERTDVSFLLGLGNYFAGGKLNNISNAWTKISRIVTVTGIEIQYEFFYIYFNATPRTMEIGDSVKVRNIEVFDLTKMFGVSNEPGTVEEFEAMFPEESYPHNVGELLSAGVNEIIEQGKNLYYSPEMLAVGMDSYEYIALGYFSKAIQLKPDTVYAVKFTSEKTSDIILLINSSSNVNANKYVDFRKLTDEKIYTTDADGKLYVGVAREKTKAEVIARLKECDIQIEESSEATSYSAYHKNTYSVPETVQQLLGYGWSTGNAYNYVDFEGKKYHKKVEKFQFNKLKFYGQDPSKKTGWNTENTFGLYAYWNGSNSSDNYHAAASSCNNDFAVTSTNAAYGYDSTENCVYAKIGYLCVRITRTWAETTLKITESSSLSELLSAVTDFFESNDYVGYFELAEEEIIDISDLIGDTFQEPFEVEAGGTLTFKNSNDGGFQIPVPSEEEYIVSLAEVGGVTE